MGENRGVSSFNLSCDRSVFLTSMQLLRYPEGDSVNYAGSKTTDTTKKQGALNLMATTDDGYIIVWNVQSVRHASENNYRKKYTGLKVSKSRGLFITSEEEGGATGHDRADSPSPDRPGTTDTAETGQDLEDDGDGNGNGEAKDGENSISSLGLITEWDASTFFVSSDTKGNEFLKKIEYNAFWLAHKDSISTAVPMPEHSCLMTGSHDGFHRVWNLEKTCLEEMQLPNSPKNELRRTLFYRSHSEVHPGKNGGD